MNAIELAKILKTAHDVVEEEWKKIGVTYVTTAIDLSDAQKEQIQKRINEGEDPKFAIAIFDCDDLKHINDTYGHEKGDVYLKN